ncbi:hypothetical protein NM208_g7264 [Fusarium decemcellulare]|uniref:Uncharacterized protein n=1 Tax=Fusarium decemcellulare TaxID=57161 RepID=A0ACC1S9W6_9HYPO|nr:hypothetical protein NM208_g7264 [Fusarium decemcellulare]
MSLEELLKPVPGVQPTRSGIYLWRYLPNAGAAALFLILFLATFLYISWKIWRTGARFCIVFAIGCFMEMVGYGVRAGARSKTGKLMPFCIQNTFILIAPVLFAATIYMMLGRVIIHTGGVRHSLVNPAKITLVFVLGDFLSFVVQCGGAGMSVVQNAELSKWSERIVVIGLLIQIIMFALFCVIAVVFHRRLRRAPTSPFLDADETLGHWRWEADLYLLYAVSFLIMVRSVFRTIEYCQGHTGYALSHEWTLYVFDALLMFAVAAIFAWKFPGHLQHQGGRDQVNINMK